MQVHLRTTGAVGVRQIYVECDRACSQVIVRFQSPAVKVPWLLFVQAFIGECLQLGLLIILKEAFFLRVSVYIHVSSFWNSGYLFKSLTLYGCHSAVYGKMKQENVHKVFSVRSYV